jgi:Ala-tRNA(Pro) deacylase
MAIAITLNDYLAKHHVCYDVIGHKQTASSLDTSATAHVPTHQLAKAVVLQSDEGDYLMACVPSNNRLSLDGVSKRMGRHYRLVPERELPELFPDCEPGAVPGIGAAYGLEMMVDDELLDSDSVFIEGGDHCHLLKIDHHQFVEMLQDMPHGNICGDPIGQPRRGEHLVHDW